MNIIDEEIFFHLKGTELRAALMVFRRFYINKYELVFLSSMAAMMMIEGRRTVNREKFFRWIGVGKNFIGKSSGYTHGLISKGCLHTLNYKSQPGRGGNTFCISEFGVRVLEYYYQVSKDLEKPAAISFRELGVNTRDMREKIPDFILVRPGKDQ